MDNSKAQILACAKDIYFDSGLDGLSMRKVADCVGVSATAIYRHYSNKDSLICHILLEGFDMLSQYLTKSLEGSTPLERFTLTLENYKKFSIEQPRFYEIMFSSGIQLNPDITTDQMRQRTSAPFKYLTDRVRECINEGIFKHDDPIDIAFTVWSHTHGLVSLNLARKFSGGTANTIPTISFDEIYDKSIDLLLNGLAT